MIIAAMSGITVLFGVVLVFGVLSWVLYNQTKEKASNVDIETNSIDLRTYPLTPQKEELKPEPPSCFAQGIVKSLLTEPEKWVEKDLDELSASMWATSVLNIKHANFSVVLQGFRNIYITTGSCSGSCFSGSSVVSYQMNTSPYVDVVNISVADFPVSLSTEDIKLILDTLNKNPSGQVKSAILKHESNKALEAIALKRFESLGCTPPNDPI